MHGEELKYMTEAYETNWMSTIGANINEVEKMTAEKVGSKYAVALSCGTASLHLAVKLAGVKQGDKVFCSDMTFAATVIPIAFEGGIPIFIDEEYESWNIDPVALEKAFELHPDVNVVVIANLYGTPAKYDEILSICKKHNAVLIEDAAESFGATYKGKQTGTFGDCGVISFNGNKIITGSSGGMLLTDDLNVANRVRKWSTQSRENAPWYQHEELGYNYRMSNVVAGVVRGQLPYLEEHIEKKKEIYGIIDRKAERVTQLLSDMFLMMKMDQSEYTIKREKVEIEEFIRTICVEYYDEIEKNRFDFVIDIPETHENVWIDLKLFQRVIC